MIEKSHGPVFSALVALIALPAIVFAQAPTSQSPIAPGGAAPGGRSAVAPPATHTPPAAVTPSTASPTASRAAPGTPSATGRYATEAEAKSHCSGDTVVWANLKSKIYHFSGTKDYGTTKEGTYMCEKETAVAGIRAAKNEKHP